jgi:acyl-CoA reductase-like NAD-dependent aldehyde dehydrogenase
MPSRSSKPASNGKARSNGSPTAHAVAAPSSGERLEVLKTYKLAIDGKFPRSESGRTMLVCDAAGTLIAHASKASRKDLRDAVEAARKAQPGWAAATAYLRGQILYRIAEMLEGRRGEFRDLLTIHANSAAKVTTKNTPKPTARTSAKAATASPAALTPDAEVSAAVDRLVHYAGWADKYAQVLGCNNPVAGPHYNFTVPEPTGVVGIICPDAPALLALVSLLAPVICSGNTAVLLGSQTNPLAPAVFAETCLTGDVPAGVINVLTGERAELLSHFATHREIDAIHAANLSPAEMTTLREGVAENLKRVILRGGGKAGTLDFTNAATCESPRWIEDFVEMKTIWHPAGV